MKVLTLFISLFFLLFFILLGILFWWGEVPFFNLVLVFLFYGGREGGRGCWSGKFSVLKRSIAKMLAFESVCIQEPRKGETQRGFPQSRASRPRNRKIPSTLGPAVHLALRAPQPREGYILAKTPSKKNPFLVPDLHSPSRWYGIQKFRAGSWQNGFFSDFCASCCRICSPHLCLKKSSLMKKASRKISGKNPPKCVLQNSSTHFCRGARPTLWTHTP